METNQAIYLKLDVREADNHQCVFTITNVKNYKIIYDWRTIFIYQMEDEKTDKLVSFFITWYKLTTGNVYNLKLIHQLFKMWMCAWLNYSMKNPLLGLQHTLKATLAEVFLYRMEYDEDAEEQFQEKAIEQAEQFIRKYCIQ